MPFIVQWVRILPLLLIVYFAPPLPWWLFRKDRRSEAEVVVRRLSNPTMFGAVDRFRRSNARGSEVVMVFVMQLLSGEEGRTVPPDGRHGRRDGL
jgi:hypothetical protein